MSDQDFEWGPWIEHDGRGAPRDLPESIRLEVIFSTESGSINLRPNEAISRKINHDNPGWTWKIRRPFLFSKPCPVCDDPLHRPIIKFRIQKPPAKSQQVEILREIAAGKRAPIAEPKSTPQDA